jgi:hypothetical protein
MMIHRKKLIRHRVFTSQGLIVKFITTDHVNNRGNYGFRSLKIPIFKPYDWQPIGVSVAVDVVYRGETVGSWVLQAAGLLFATFIEESLKYGLNP